jgi:Xaa-Pro aminopeptidase
VTGRVERAQRTMRDGGVDALLVGPSADLRYLTGYHALPLERLTLLTIPADGEPTLLVPALEEPRAADSGAGEVARIVTWEETEDPFAMVASGLDGVARVAVQDHLFAAFLLRLQAEVPGREWLPGATVMRELRMIKQPDEVDALRTVGRAIDGVHARVPELLRAGRTEAEVGRDIGELIRAEHDEVDFIIVASGPNGASPHHETGTRRLQDGDAVVVDIGGTLDGYCSDSTRNYTVGQAPDGYREIHDIVERAQRAACDAVRPGVTAASIDAAAREVITAAGYGDRFIHRTGHGIGIEVHEDPYIVGGNDLTLQPGMTFSIEPGIYLPGRFGVRIEDIVAVTDDGVERMNVRDRSFVEVAS